MADFTVHGIPGSPYTRAVLMTLAEKGAGWRLAPLAVGASKSPEHLLRHPFGRIPVLDHGDFRLYETQAILRYLDRLLPDPPLTPADLRAAARMDQAMNVCDWYLFRDVGTVIGFQRIVAPRLFGLAPDEAAIAAALPKARTVTAELDRLLGDARFFGGAALSLADLLIAAHLEILALTPEWQELAATHGALVEWLGRMAARESFEATTWERLAALAA
jgi:glutathione S-transferase